MPGNDPAAWGAAPAGPYGAPQALKPIPITNYYGGAADNDYVARARNAFYNQPSLNTINPDAPRITPAQFLREKIASEAQERGLTMSPEHVEAGLQTVFNHMIGAKAGSPMAVRMSRAVLNELKGQSPVGDPDDPTSSTHKRSFAGQTLKQREDRRRDWFQDGRFMTSAGLDNQLEALRAYTLLGALEDDPKLKLPMFNSSGNFLSAAGMINPGNPRQWFGKSDPTTDPGAGIRHLAYLRNVHSPLASPVEARQLEALYWDRLGDRARGQEGQYRSSLEGGYYWPYSFLNDAGMGRVSEDRANFLSNTDENVSQYLRDWNMWGGQQGRELSRLGALVSREVPIVPEGVAPEQTRDIQDQFRKLSNQTHQRLIDEYPLWQEQYNKLMPGTAMDVKEYSFPSPAWNSLATAPAYSLDTITASTMGLGLPANIAKSGVRGATRGLLTDFVLDQPSEQGFGAGFYSANNDGDLSGFFQPFTKSNVSDDPGKPGDGGQYRKQFYEEFKPQQQNDIRMLRDYYNANHPSGQLQIERNMPSPFTGRRR
jgi:hypothetical protein